MTSNFMRRNSRLLMDWCYSTSSATCIQKYKRTLAITILILLPSMFFSYTQLVSNQGIAWLQLKDATVRVRGGRHAQLPDRPSRYTRVPSVCSDGSCKSAYLNLRNLPRMPEYPVPAIRHIIWVNESVSEYFAEHLLTWQRVHPDWTYVLWRDQDLERFVATHFPGLLAKFKSLHEHIMRVDMIRYMLLFKYGGVYADLDYSLVSSITEFRRFPAVVTREPEAHSIHVLGWSWPVEPLANCAFMLAAPGHVFFHFVLEQLQVRHSGYTLSFAGPEGLTDMMEKYQSLFPMANNPMEAVYIPPSFSFFPYRNNRMDSSRNSFLPTRLEIISKKCDSLMSRITAAQRSQFENLTRYCQDVNNMDSITDKSQPVFAIHDLQKKSAYYGGPGIHQYTERLVEMKRVLSGLQLGGDWI